MMYQFAFKGLQRMMATLLLLLCFASAHAVPVKPGMRKQLTLNDGTTVNAVLVGDEWGHFWLGDDGNAYQDLNGDNLYEQIDSNAVKSKAKARRNAANQRRSRRLAPKKVGEVGSITGDKKGIIILVNFKDKSFNASRNDFDKLANNVNYVSGNYKGSMYDYFYAQSDGQFRLKFDVVGPYTVSQNCAYYGANSNGDDVRPATMVIEALKKADADVNFADYDWDGDGEVEQVYVVYAGKGEADGGSEDTIWPHEYDLTSASNYGDGSGAQTLDGRRINTYACGGEQNGETGATAGIGTMCHEFSHCLGYPDFYDTDYSGGQGMFMWDLMDSGSYNGDGYRPAGYTSYERWVAGWKTPTELTATQTVSNMKALQNTNSDSYIIYNKGNRNEYYLLENRQKINWDADLPGAGLLILHVDYNATAWSNNTPNDTPSHQRMTWVAADNQYQYTTSQGTRYYTESGAKNDPFPYGNKNSFGRSTTPAATLYNNNSDGTKYLDSSVENITQNSDGTITFNFVGVSNVATPTFSPAAGRYENAQTVSISCATSGATIRYTTDGSVPTTSSTVYSSPLTISENTTVKAIALKDGEQSAVATAVYKIGASSSDPTTTTFRRVSSTSDLEEGLRYVIACGSKYMAAGAMGSGTYLSNVQVSISDDVLTSTDNVAVFVLEQTADGWTFQNESTNEYLVSTAAKNVSYSSTASAWTLSDGNDGVVMTAGDYGTMLYNSSSPRFTTYTSNPTSSMIQANLYVEDSNSTPVTHDPLIVADETVTFSTTVDTPQTKTFEVLSEGLTEDITVTLTSNPDNVFTLGSNTISRTASELGATGSVTFTPTTAGTYTGVITLTSAGADAVSISLSATATEVGGSTPSGETLFYEGLTGYTSNGDGSSALSTNSDYLDYSGWSNLTKVYPGGISSAYSENDGCLKLGSSSAIGSMTTGSISLTGSGTLTFYLKKYGNDTGKLNVSVTGANADVTQFTPSSAWTLCTVNLTDATGNVTITLSTSAKRAYLDEITLTSGSGTTPVQKQDVEMSFSPSSVEITEGDTFTQPTLTTNPAGLSVAYSSDNTSVATVDAEDGTVSIVGVGTAIITASFGGNDDYNEGSASYTITVNAYIDPNGPGSESDPYSVAEARDAIDAGTGIQGVYVTGIVSGIQTAYNSQYGNISYYISDDGLTTSDQLLAYRGKSYNGDNFTSANDIQVGDVVVIYGNLILYGTNTYELAQNNQLVSLQRPQKDDVSMSFNPTTATATIGETFTQPVLTTTPANLPVTYSSSDPSVATVDATTGDVTLVAAGTTVITANFAGDASYNPGSASYTLTVIGGTTPVVLGDKFELVTDASTLSDGDEILIAYVDDYNTLVLSTTQQTNNRKATTDVTLNDDDTLTPGDAAQIITLEKSDTNWMFNVGGYLYAASSTGNQLKTQDTASDNAKATITISGGAATITFQGNNTRNRMRYNPNNGNPIFSCYSSSSTTGSLPQIYRRMAVAVPDITLEDNGINNSALISQYERQTVNATLQGRTLYKDGAWNSICLPFDVTLSGSILDGAEARTMDASVMTGSHVDITFSDNVTLLEAGVPYIIKWENGEDIVNPKFENVVITAIEAQSQTSVDQSTQFIGYYDAFDIDANDTDIYYLTSDNLLKRTSKARTLKAFRTYFRFQTNDPSMNVKDLSFNIDFGDVHAITGISEIGGQDIQGSTIIYDLSGRRIQTTGSTLQGLSKGIYIVNGKKVMVQ